MVLTVYQMTQKAKDKNYDWDRAIFEDEIENVASINVEDEMTPLELDKFMAHNYPEYMDTDNYGWDFLSR